MPPVRSEHAISWIAAATIVSRVNRFNQARAVEQHEQVVRSGNTVTFRNLILQLPSTQQRAHFVRCPVTVHQSSDGSLGINHQDLLLRVTMPPADRSSPEGSAS